MSKPYIINGENMTLGTGNVLVAVRTAVDCMTAGGNIAIRRIEIGQSGSTTSAMIRGEIFTRDTAGTLTMSSATPQPISPLGGPASGITGSTAPAGTAARCGINSSADSGGTYTQRMAFTFNNLNGWLWVPTPDEVIEAANATVVGVRFLAAPGTLTGWTITFTFVELT